MTKPSGRKMAGIIVVLCAATAIASPAQTFKTLVKFDKSDGSYPESSLVQTTDGTLYGTTRFGGNSGAGTIFEITAQGGLNTLYNFCSQTNCADGSNSEASPIQGTDGNFYGTTSYGGANNLGTVFKITPGDVVTTLHSFEGTDGALPYAGLVQAADGNFYGTASGGGAYNYGTIFKINSTGTLTTLHSLGSGSTDGSFPVAALVQADDGNLYGTTYYGGAYNYGTIFKITRSGSLTTLHSFDSTDGGYPSSALVEAADGDFYGTTSQWGTCHSCGTVFRITKEGTLTTLHSFNQTDGALAAGGLIQATDRNFYGTTVQGGNLSCNPSYGCGTVFQITSQGTLTTLHTFDGTDG